MSTTEEEARAQILLKKTLGAHRWRTFQKRGYTDIRAHGIQGITTIRLYRRRWVEIHDPKGWRGICIHVSLGSEPVPPPSDQILTFYLWAKYDPARFLKIGNWSPH